MEYAVDIQIEIQPTYTFDFNSQDAMYHAELKRQLRKQGLPDSNDDLQNKFQEAINNISLDTIQRGFIQAYSKKQNGDDDSSLIPAPFTEWYDDDVSSDEELSNRIDSEEIHTDEER